MNRTTLIIVVTLIALAILSVVLITLARGYSFDINTKTFNPTGILVATSDPDGAEVRIDGELKTATNNTINLAPGEYQVRIEKDGFSAWEKKIILNKEEVFKTNAFLFPRVPDLRPMTFSGALSPTISPDGTKIAYAVASAAAERNGIFVADLGRSSLPGPLSNNADLRQIYRETPFLSLTQARFLWSADSRQVVAYFSPTPLLLPVSDLSTPSATPLVLNKETFNPEATVTAAYLLDADRLNESPQLVTFRLTELLISWDNLRKTEALANMSKLDPILRQSLVDSVGKLEFSPDQTKILYQATASGSIPTIIASYIPGRNPTPETRNLTPGKIYVYDLKEDKNYLIPGDWSITERYQFSSQWPANTSQFISWFPSSRHLLSHAEGEIALTEYDGSNKAVIYGGPFVDAIVFPWPNWGKIIILTSLNTIAGIGENLYTINLR